MKTPVIIPCGFCGIDTPKVSLHDVRRYCSDECQRKARIREIVRRDQIVAREEERFNHSSEAVVVVDLVAKGYKIYYPFGQIGPCDLVAVKSGEWLRVEVKTIPPAYAHQTVIPSVIDWQKADVGAFVQHDNSVLYHPTID